MDSARQRSTPGWASALAEWRALLGEAHVLTGPAIEPYRLNASGLAREIPAVLRPSRTEEVQGVVRVASRHRTPLFPVSRGCNWGLGSRLPVEGGCAVLDLGRMNRIREINVEGAYAIIEPGVTQEQLYRHLADNRLPLLLNVTGSSRDSSLIGNALERGIGYFASRAEALSGLEVVLGDGELIRTGFAQFPNARTAHLYRHGIGPALDGLFFQSNMGVVTAAGFALMPRPEAQTSLLAKLIRPNDFPAFVDALAALQRRGLLRGVIHIGNRARTEIALGPLLYDELRALGYPEQGLADRTMDLLAREGFGAWSAITGIMGTAGQVKSACREVRLALRGIAQVRFMSPAGLARIRRVLDALGRFEGARIKGAVLRAVTPLQGLAAGVPTDAALNSVCWPVERATHAPPFNPDDTRGGLLYCLPFCGLNGRDGAEVMAIADEVCGRHGFVPYVTFNTLDAKIMEAVINIAFDRADAESVRRAHACNDEMLDRYLQAGFPPYRVGIQSMAKVVDPGNPHCQASARIKTALDPAHIIAPGRYSLI